MNLALYNTISNEVISRCLTTDMVDHQLYRNGLIKYEHIKVIESPNDCEIFITENGTIKFNCDTKPNYLGLNY